MNDRVRNRTVIAVAVGLVVIALGLFIRAIWPVIVDQGLGIVLIAFAVAGAVWLYDWYTEQRTPS